MKMLTARTRWETFRDDLYEKFPQLSSLHYVGETGERDLRIDFIRGMVMSCLLVIHFEFFSWYNLLAWERFGAISGAEGFVILSGVVVGMVYKRKIQTIGMKEAMLKLVDRAAQLYRVNVFIALSVILLSMIPFVNTHLLRTYTNEHTGEVYQLFPSLDAGIITSIGQILRLQATPHYTQILGLYVFALLAAPLAMWMMASKRTGLMLGLSLTAYLINQSHELMITGAQFEYGFPLLSWQLLFFGGLAVGYHRERVMEFTRIPFGKVFMFVAAVLFVGFLIFANNNPNPNVPDWAKFSFITSDQFYAIYEKYFFKDHLGILRILNYIAALTVCYALLTRYWRVFEQTLGKFFIPLGQASLYVFIVHIYLVLALYHTGIVKMGNQYLSMSHGNVWFNTLVHTAVLFTVWLMVKKKFLFRWIPR